MAKRKVKSPATSGVISTKISKVSKAPSADPQLDKTVYPPRDPKKPATPDPPKPVRLVPKIEPVKERSGVTITNPSNVTTTGTLDVDARNEIIDALTGKKLDMNISPENIFKSEKEEEEQTKKLIKAKSDFSVSNGKLPKFNMLKIPLNYLDISFRSPAENRLFRRNPERPNGIDPLVDAARTRFYSYLEKGYEWHDVVGTSDDSIVIVFRYAGK